MNTTTQPTTTLSALGRFKLYTLALAWSKQMLTLPVQGCLRDQLQRAVLSVVLNIAEGGAQGSVRAKNKYFRIARASAWEVSAVVDVLAAMPGVARVKPDSVDELRQIDAMLSTLVRKG